MLSFLIRMGEKFQLSHRGVPFLGVHSRERVDKHSTANVCCMDGGTEVDVGVVDEGMLGERMICE